MEQTGTLVDTTRVSRTSSLRISLPRRIAEQLDVSPSDIIGYYMSQDGDIILRKLK